MRLARRLLPLALALTVAAFPAAAAAEPTTRAEAQDALQEAQQVLDGQGVRTGREATPALARLAAGKSLLDSADRREANGLLSRPTDGAADPQRRGYTTDEATPFCTPNFCVHYVTSTDDAPSLTDADADSIPDYVELMAQEFEYVRSVENGANQMGWRPPVSDGTRGGNSKTDVYIKQLGDQGIFGYAATEGSGQTRSAYQVMDDDYSEFGPTTPVDARQVTAAHEYNHVLQFAYDTYQDSWMFEATATWAEEQVFPGANDYVGYLRSWAGCTSTPLTTGSQSGTPCQRIKMYGSAVWNHWLSARFDRGLIRSAWEGSQASGSFAPAAYGNAVSPAGGPGRFSAEFAAFSASTAEWRAPGSVFPDAGCGYPDVQRVSTLSVGGAAQSMILDHTTFSLIDVPVPASGTSARLTATLPSGLDGAIALVGRTGSSAGGGAVTTAFRRLPTGGAGQVALDDPGQYGRITAVLVNGSTAEAGVYNQAIDDYNWTQDAQVFSNVQVTSAAGGDPGEVTSAGTSAPRCSRFAGRVFDIGSTSPATASPGPAPAPAAGAPAGGGGTGTTTAPASPGPAPAPAAGAPAGGGSNGTTTAPALASRLTLKSPQKVSAVLAKGVGFRLRCNRACRVKGRLRLAGASTHGLKRNQTIGTVSTRLSKAGVKTISIKLTRKARAALRGKRRVKVTLALVVTPSSGKSTRITRTLTLRR